MTTQAKRLKALMRVALKTVGVPPLHLSVRTEVRRYRDSVSGMPVREYGKANGFVDVPVADAAKVVAEINARSPRARAYVLYEHGAYAVVTAED